MVYVIYSLHHAAQNFSHNPRTQLIIEKSYTEVVNTTISSSSQTAYWHKENVNTHIL